MNAMRSRWAGFIFAWILKTKALNSGLSGSSTSPFNRVRGWGAGDISRNFSKNSCTPKLVMALPKNMGVSSPFNTSSIWNSSPAMSSSSMSPSSASNSSSPIISLMRGSSMSAENSSNCLLPWLASVLNKETSRVRRLYTPLYFPSRPTGQVMGYTLICRIFSTSSIRSKGSRPKRSSLLIKVKIGRWRRWQTQNSFLVWGSTPLAASISMTALSAAIRVRYVSSEKS